MANETIKIPDLGGADDVDVIEISVKPGDEIAAEDTLLVLESDKASMDIPSPKAGVVKKVLVNVGDKVSAGTAILEIEAAGEASESQEPEQEQEQEQTPEVEEKGKEEEKEKETSEDKSEQSSSAQEKAAAEKEQKAAPKGQPSKETVNLPDLGTSDTVDVIELAVSVGDTVAEGDTLLTLEGDKAAMDVPSPYNGKVAKLLVKEGDKVKSGDAVVEIDAEAAEASEAPEADQAAPETAEAEETSAAKPSKADDKEKQTEKKPDTKTPTAAASDQSLPDDSKLGEPEAPAADVYAGPMVRQFARELGVDLRNVSGSGDKSRIIRDDVLAYVKKTVAAVGTAASDGAVGAGIPTVPDVDYSQFGEIEEIPLSRIAKLTAANMSRTWLNVPAVTQFDDADITEMEEFRKNLKAEAEQRGVKLTPVAFILLACAHALRAHPTINRSWHSSGEKVIQKKFVHIGMAVNTPRGLLVPVIRDVDRKGLWELAEESAAVAQKARDGKLSANDMQGGSFSISSLGAIGGKGFTPIVNSPEAAILAVSKASVQPVWNGSEFLPRQMLPLSLTYDHRLINGADAGSFLTDLVGLLGDIRRLLL